MAAPKYSRVQEKGQITVPVDIRRNMGLVKGDLVAFEEKDGGVLITPRMVLMTKALDEIGVALREQGLCLDDLIESGREERGYITQEMSEHDIAIERD